MGTSLPFIHFRCRSDEKSSKGSNLPEPKTSVTLPPEILDKILEYVLTDGAEGRPTLIACALVATWWTGPSQRRLFSSVSIYHRNYRRWMDGVVLSGSKTHLLGYVRSLEHSLTPNTKNMYQMRDLQKDSGEYLSALHNIHSLTLLRVRIEVIGGEGFHTCFSAFRETLIDLTLQTVVTSFSAFVTLVSYFPNISTLRLGLVKLVPDEEPVPSLPQPLQGEVRVFSSITCNKLHRIIFLVNRMNDLNAFLQGVGVWTSIDKWLCELVARLGRTGYRHTLEVEVRLTEIGDGLSEHDFTRFFPEFREKGVTTIIDADRGELVLHSSTRSR